MYYVCGFHGSQITLEGRGEPEKGGANKFVKGSSENGAQQEGHQEAGV